MSTKTLQWDLMERIFFDSNGNLYFVAAIILAYSIFETPNNILLSVLNLVDESYLKQYDWFNEVTDMFTLFQIAFALIAVVMPVYLLGLGQSANGDQVYYITPALTFNLGPPWLFYLYIRKVFQVS